MSDIELRSYTNRDGKRIQRLFDIWRHTNPHLGIPRLTLVLPNGYCLSLFVSTLQEGKSLKQAILTIPNIDNRVILDSGTGFTSINIYDENNLRIVTQHLECFEQSYLSSTRDIANTIVTLSAHVSADTIYPIIQWLGNLPAIKQLNPKLAYIVKQCLILGMTPANALTEWRQYRCYHNPLYDEFSPIGDPLNKRIERLFEIWRQTYPRLRLPCLLSVIPDEYSLNCIVSSFTQGETLAARIREIPNINTQFNKVDMSTHTDSTYIICIFDRNNLRCLSQHLESIKQTYLQSARDIANTVIYLSRNHLREIIPEVIQWLGNLHAIKQLNPKLNYIINLYLKNHADPADALIQWTRLRFAAHTIDTHSMERFSASLNQLTLSPIFNNGRPVLPMSGNNAYQAITTYLTPAVIDILPDPIQRLCQFVGLFAWEQISQSSNTDNDSVHCPQGQP